MNTHSRPEDVMQKVEEACWPRPHATSLKRLFRSSPRSPERPSRGTVELTCRQQPMRASRQHRRATGSRPGRGQRDHLGGLRVIQVPELDVSVPGGDEVGAVVGEGDGPNLAGHLVGGDQDVLLRNTPQGRVSVARQRPSPAAGASQTFQFHTFTIMSCWYPTLTMYFPFGENATQATPYLCSSNWLTCRRSETSQTRTAGR